MFYWPNIERESNLEVKPLGDTSYNQWVLTAKEAGFSKIAIQLFIVLSTYDLPAFSFYLLLPQSHSLLELNGTWVTPFPSEPWDHKGWMEAGWQDFLSAPVWPEQHYLIHWDYILAPIWKKGSAALKCFTTTVLVQSSHIMCETSRVQTDYMVCPTSQRSYRQSWTKHVGFLSPIHSLSMNSGITSGQKSLRGILS